MSHYATCSAQLISAIGIPNVIPPAALTIKVGIRYKYGIKLNLSKKFLLKISAVFYIPTVRNKENQVLVIVQFSNS